MAAELALLSWVASGQADPLPEPVPPPDTETLPTPAAEAAEPPAADETPARDEVLSQGESTVEAEQPDETTGEAAAAEPNVVTTDGSEEQ